MDAKRKCLTRQLGRLRKILERGDLDGFNSELAQHPEGALFVGIREQKLIFRAAPDTRDGVAAILRAAASRCLPEPLFNDFDQYLEFALLFVRARQQLMAELKALLPTVANVPRRHLFVLADEAFQAILKNTVGRTRPEVGETVALFERRVHNANGVANDTAFAVMRLLNELASAEHVAISVRQINHRLLVHTMAQLAALASRLNSLEWAFDSVTYGDFRVKVIESGSEPRFRFDYVDPRLALLRTIHIRRGLVLNLGGLRGPRYVRERLRELMPAVIHNAVSFFQDEFSGVRVTRPAIKQIHDHAERVLTVIDAEDDLLLAAAGPDRLVATYYSCGMALSMYAFVAEIFRRQASSRGGTLYGSPRLPLLSLAAMLDDGENGDQARACLEKLTAEWPSRSHFDLMRRPFVKDEGHSARAVLPSQTAEWNLTVRQALLAGGVLGKSFGSRWEEFYEWCFAGSEWNVLGRGVHVRRGGKLITDVDLLLHRGDLLLVVQIKAMVGSAHTVYDHWRNRQTVELGCRQARVAADVLAENKERLTAIASRRVANEINIIQPVVLTNVHYFEGWSFDGVPVISESMRNGITEGLKVTYHAGSGELVHTEVLLDKNDLSTERILWAFSNPAELQVAPESIEVEHWAEQVGHVTLELPDFRMNPTEASSAGFKALARSRARK